MAAQRHNSEGSSHVSGYMPCYSPASPIFSETATRHTSLTTSTESAVSQAAPGLVGQATYGSLASLLAPQTGGRGVNSKLDIFASLRSEDHDDVDRSRARLSPEQEHIDALADEIMAFLGSSDEEHTDGEGEAHVSPKGEAEANDDIDHMLDRIKEHNERCSNTLQSSSLRYEFEDNHSDKEAIRDNIKQRLRHPGEKRATQKQKIKARMEQAKARQDPEEFERFKLMKREVNQRIVDEYSANALQPLREEMNDAEETALRELKELHDLHRAHLALMFDNKRTVSLPQLVDAVESKRHRTLSHIDDTLIAINDGHIPAASHLLTSAYKASRRSTTRFRRMCAADIADASRKHEVIEKRFEDTGAGNFIARAVVELGDAQNMVDMSKGVMKRMDGMLAEVERELKEVEDGLEVALLCHLAEAKPSRAAEL